MSLTTSNYDKIVSALVDLRQSIDTYRELLHTMGDVGDALAALVEELEADHGGIE